MTNKTNSLTQAILHLLNASGFRAWRTGNHAVYSVKRKSFMKNPSRLLGIPDVSGYRKKDGKAIYVEVKTGKDKLSEAQKHFLSEAQKAGCIVIVAENIEQVQNVLMAEKICEHDWKPCEHPAVWDFDKCTKCKKIRY